MITVTFLNGCILATAEQSLWQYSYNQQLEIIGLELPEVFTVDFCNTGSTQTVAMVGSNNVVGIPNELLVSGSGITAYVFQKSALTGGITRCEIRIDVLPRPERDDSEPTPEQQTAIDQLIEELNEGVDAADESAEDAEAWAVGERGGVPVEEGDPTYENNAKYYAGLASVSETAAKEAADAADQSAGEAAESAPFYAEYGVTTRSEVYAAINGKRQVYVKTNVFPDAMIIPLTNEFMASDWRTGYRFMLTRGTTQHVCELTSAWTSYANDLSAPADRAEEAAAQALNRMNSADASAQSAAGSASNASRDAGTASAAATTATEKAGEASDSATAADGSAKDAEAYAVGKRGGTDVGSSDPAYHNNAKYYAEQAASSASDAVTAKGAAETAQGKAEDAQEAAEQAQEAAEAVLESIPSDYTELSDDVNNLKSAFDYGEITGSSAIFESGSFSSTGSNSSNTKRLRTIGYIPDNIKSVRAINGYQLGVYCYYKSNNAWAGFVYTNGNVGTDTLQFNFHTSFDFNDPAYNAYNFRLLCAGPNISATMTVDEASNYVLAKDGAKSAVENALESIPVLAYNAYIKNEVGYGNTVSLLPITYNGFVCAVCECKEGDVFTVTGVGGGSGRLWSFVDSDNALLSAAGSSISACSEIVIAPVNSAKAIFNASALYEYNFTKGNISNFTSGAKAELIKSAVVHDFPAAIVRPSIGYKAAVNQVSGVSDVKGSIFRNGNDFCIVYNENLDGNVNDLPTVSGTGTLAVKYKFFHFENGVESNVSYGEIARKGDTYTTWDENTAQLDGGCGVPCGSNGLQYFSSAYIGTKRYNGKDNYGLRPCACTVSVDSSGVTFGEIKELSLTINGVTGAFDIARIDPTYEDYYIYYTTTPPCKVSNNLRYWLQPVLHGIAAFRSSNGFDWEFIGVAETPYQPQCEVTCVSMGGNNICFAARTREQTNPFTESNLYIGRMQVTAAAIYVQYKMQSITSRGYLVRDDKGILLFYNSTSYDEFVCIRVTPNGSNYQFFFHKWFSIYRDCTWYVTTDESSLTADYTKIFIVGNNGSVNNNRGLSFMELDMAASPKIIADMAAGIE